jgi:hypothetical protein
VATDFCVYAAILLTTSLRRCRHEFRFAKGVRALTGRLNLIAFAVLMVLATIAVAGAVVMAASLTSQPARPSGRVTPITDPTNLKRLALGDLSYQGAFRLPADEVDGVSFSFGGYPAAFNPERGSLFIGARGGFIAEVTIPDPVNSGDIAALPFAAFVQRFAEASDGRIKKEIAADGASLSGLLVHDRRLLGTASIYYDANNEQSLSHFSRPLALADSASKFVRVWQSGKTGFVAGYMAEVPPEWQSRLGGSVVTGQCCLPIISRTSWGPSLFSFDPAEVYAGHNANANPLLYYDAAHPTLGAWEGSNPTYGGSTQVGGVALIGGSRTALFIGRNGTGPFCYGNGTGNQSQVSTRGPDGEVYCFDPTASDKGQHAYPYRYQAWAYDLAELAEVRAGKRDPWEAKPYAIWPLEFPIAESGVRIGSVAYDRAGRRVFVVQMQADRDGYAYRPLVHVFRVP